MFKPIDRSQNRLRLALDGPAGSGKTYTALRFAFGIVARERAAGRPCKIAVIDTEHHSASLYAGEKPDGIEWRWDGVDLEHFAPSTYEQAIKEAARLGYHILVIDSLSHAWVGKGGALEQVDRKRDSAAGGSFGAWRDVGPQHNALVDAIIRYPGHVIATLRSKMEYVIEEDEKTKKKRVEKVGLKSIQREGVEYEFDVVGDLDQEHVLKITKTRFSGIDGQIVVKPGPEFLHGILDWLGGANPAPEPRESTVPATQPAGSKSTRGAPAVSAPVRTSEGGNSSTGDAVAATIKGRWRDLGWPVEKLVDFVRSKGVATVSELPTDIGQALLHRLEKASMEHENPF